MEARPVVLFHVKPSLLNSSAPWPAQCSPAIAARECGAAGIWLGCYVRLWRRVKAEISAWMPGRSVAVGATMKNSPS